MKLGGKWGEVWTEERTNLLKALWAENKLTIVEIAKRLGGNFNKNSVGGKARGLGLPLKGRPNATRKPKPKYIPKPTPGASLMRIIMGSPEIVPTFAPPPVDVEDTKTPLEQRKQLVDLGDHDCRWPIGEPGKPGFYFCGAAALDGHPYCSVHCARAYNYLPRSQRRAA